MCIESYSFGNIVINGHTYTSDIIIFPDGRIQDSWWRKAGHSLSISDVTELVNAKPKVIIAGTGASGLMSPDMKLEGVLSQKGIEFRAVPTAQAVRLYNEMSKTKRVGACFHLTC